ncbi:MAG: hypothetical protein AAGF29_06225, partial [Pseudomonadota bacterium]
MLESGLFFTLGFLCSGLLALMVAPAIWRRAVVLTRQRIESAVPLTLNEIQADKDQLRAEFAMSTRRLEVSLEDLKTRSAEQMIEINRRRDEMIALEEDHKRKLERMAELENQGGDLRTELRERENRLNAVKGKLATLEEKLAAKTLDYDELNERYRDAVDEFDGQKIELVARETRIDTIADEARDTKASLIAERERVKGAEHEMKAAQAAARREAKRADAAEDTIADLRATLADLEGRLERRELDLDRLRNRSGASSDQNSDLQTQLDEALNDKLQLQAELAQTVLRMDALVESTASGDTDSAISAFQGERRELRNALQQAEQERDALRVELDAIRIASGDDWEADRRENALVRERINDLAAQVTAMTATLEGPDSPINIAL